MDSILALLIGAAVSCVVYFLATISIGSGKSPAPEKSVSPSQTDGYDTAAIAVAAPTAPAAVAPPPVPAVAAPAVEQDARSQRPAAVAAIPKCVAFFDVETTGLTEKDRIVTIAGRSFVGD